jgi:hypothetical protein
MAARYEDLRRHRAKECSGGLGRVLLTGRGMAAWMQAWRHSVPAWEQQLGGASGRPLAYSDGSGTEAVLPDVVQGQAVRILAGMAAVVIQGEMTL